MFFFKKINMVLQKQTNSGLTYGQIIATVAVLTTLMGVGIQTNIRMSKIEIEQATQKIFLFELQKGRDSNAQSIKELTFENKTDHMHFLVVLR